MVLVVMKPLNFMIELLYVLPHSIGWPIATFPQEQIGITFMNSIMVDYQNIKLVTL
jgi:hypothetical protein